MTMDYFRTGLTRRQVIRSLVGGSLLLPGVLSQLFAAEDQGAAIPGGMAEDFDA